jgi:hypothetical protein
MLPGQPNLMSVEGIFGHEHAYRVIQAAMQDYDETYGG